MHLIKRGTLGAMAFATLMALTANMRPVEEPKEVLLWPNGAPGSEGKTGAEKVRIAETGDHVISGIHSPSITPFIPAAGTATGAAIIIAPGGGHAELWIDHEGYNPAKWFQARGIATFVLKYRLAREQGSTYTVDRDELADIQRAIRLVRSRAAEWGIDTARVGVMGFSAGGELAALSAMRFDAGNSAAPDAVDRLSSRPAFQALIYPGHTERFEVVPHTPPAFLAAGYQDRPDISEGIAEVYLKYKKAGVPAELHIYANIGHGFGMRTTNKGAYTEWPAQLHAWLANMGFLTSGKALGMDHGQRGAPVAGNAWALPLPDKTLLDMVWIRPGSFVMGSPAMETGRKTDEGPETEVKLSRGYWLGKTEVTIGQWRAVTGMGIRDQVDSMLHDDRVYDFGGRKAVLRDFMHFDPHDPEKIMANEGDSLPMYFVSWSDAVNFCKKLTDRERAAGRLPEGYVYHLPTEAQWEFACRAGTTAATFEGPMTSVSGTSSVLDDIAWYAGNSPIGYTGRRLGNILAGPRNAGEKMANPWGLKDMYGNLWEWCRDWYGPYPGGTVTDPQGPPSGTGKVNRGGSWVAVRRMNDLPIVPKTPRPKKAITGAFV
jgi:formylglycine-generating enzyme required for sulfatase activity/acetyl esterase/lipase